MGQWPLLQILRSSYDILMQPSSHYNPAHLLWRYSYNVITNQLLLPMDLFMKSSFRHDWPFWDEKISYDFDSHQYQVRIIEIEWIGSIINSWSWKRNRKSKRQNRVACLKLGGYETLIFCHIPSIMTWNPLQWKNYRNNGVTMSGPLQRFY